MSIIKRKEREDTEKSQVNVGAALAANRLKLNQNLFAAKAAPTKKQTLSASASLRLIKQSLRVLCVISNKPRRQNMQYESVGTLC